MDNGSRPATSIEFRSPNDSGGTDITQWKGLTKREHFAGLAMQGFISKVNIDLGDEYPENNNTLVRVAIIMADELLKELDR